MKKNIAFVIPSLAAGGGEKSLVNLLNSFNYEKYDVDLILLNKQGLFLNSVPEEVKIIDLNDDYFIFTQNIRKAICDFTKQGKFRLAVSRLWFTLNNLMIKNVGVAEQKGWKYLVKSIHPLPKRYDTAIGFLEKSSIYFAVDCIKSSSKIGFIHNDYDKLDLDPALDFPYFDKLNAIVTVSDECSRVLKKRFPSVGNKVKVIHNVISTNLIRKLSLDEIEINTSIPLLLSIGRLHTQKGFDIAIDAAVIMKEKGLVFRWYVIGEGAERNFLKKKIKDSNLEKEFVLLGLRENPYPYLKAATLYVQPSRYEGKSIAIDEAKIMGKPIVVTDFSTAKDQIESGRTGIIAEMTATGVATAITNLLDNTILQMQLSSNLAREDLGTENEVNKLYTILNE